MSSTGGGIPPDEDPRTRPIIIIGDSGQELKITRGDWKVICDFLPPGDLKSVCQGYYDALPT